jgi:hypothetical protein
MGIGIGEYRYYYWWANVHAGVDVVVVCTATYPPSAHQSNARKQLEMSYAY